MPSVPAKSGYTFGGWYTSTGGGGTQFTGTTMVSANITVYARWVANAPSQYTVTFNADGGSPSTQTRTVTSGAPVGSGNWPFDPVKNGYTFGGWYTQQNGGGTPFTASTAVNANITVYARWTPDAPGQYTVTFDADEGDPSTQTSTVTSGASIGSGKMPSDPVKSGYTFGGCYTEQNGGGLQFTATTTVSGNTVVYAKWTAQYTVTFNADGGNFAEGNTTQTRAVNSGGSLGLANIPSDPSKSGYAFGGWYTSIGGGGTAFTATTTVSGDIVVYAKWVIIQWTVAFNLEGGNIDGDTATQTRTVSNGDSVGSATPADPGRDGYTFGGWFTEQNGGGTQFMSSMTVTGDKTFYAKWTPQWIVTFNLEGGNINGVTTVQTRTVNNGDSVGSATPADPGRDGYTFGGWFTEQNGGGLQFTSSTTITGHITVYGKWTILSDNADLLSLTVTSGKLSPAFSPQTLQYSLTLLNDTTDVTISAVKMETNAVIDTPSQTIDLNVGESKTVTITVTAENGKEQTYTVNAVREAPVFYDNAEGSFDPMYTANVRAQYASGSSQVVVSGVYSFYYNRRTPYAGSRSLYIGGGNPPLIVGTFYENAYIQLTITLERKAEISFYYANDGGATSVYNSVNWPLSTATFSVNNETKQTFSADSSPSWRKVTFSLDAGTNVLRWQKQYGVGAYTLNGQNIIQQCLYLCLDEITIVYTE
jgi:uncharacterized repeat protein (TIGR02543 family)